MKKTISILLILVACGATAGESDGSWVDRYVDWIYSGEATATLVPGVRLTYPQGVAVSGAAFINVVKIVKGESNSRYFRGLLFQIEPGYGGLKSGVGVGGVDSLGYLGGLKLSHYRTWSDFAGLDSGEEYIGLDATLSGFLSSFTLGVYTGLDDEASDFLFSAGWGFGF